MASAVSDTGENGTVSDDSEGDMYDSSVGREYNIQTNNGFSVLTEGQMRDSTVPRSKRKRTNTGSVDEETFQTLSNDQKLGIIFQKLIDIEEKQSTIGKLEKSIEATDNNVSSIKSTIDGHSNTITLLTYKSLDLEARSRRKNLCFEVCVRIPRRIAIWWFVTFCQMNSTSILISYALTGLIELASVTPGVFPGGQ